jgi:hypothetical protein
MTFALHAFDPDEPELPVDDPALPVDEPELPADEPALPADEPALAPLPLLPPVLPPQPVVANRATRSERPTVVFIIGTNLMGQKRGAARHRIQARGAEIRDYFGGGP